MRFLKDIFLLVAGSLLLLHSFIPHEHQTEIGQAQYIGQNQPTGDLLDFFQSVFQIDLGEDHLETFETASFYSVQHSFAETCEELRFPINEVRSEIQLPHYTSFSSLEEICTLKFRGPPSMS